MSGPWKMWPVPNPDNRPHRDPPLPPRRSRLAPEDDDTTLVIDGPTAMCGHCNFTAALRGTFSVEAGQLVWRGDLDPQPGRGPDLEGCCESDPVIEFTHIRAAGEHLDPNSVGALRMTAREARWDYDD